MTPGADYAGHGCPVELEMPRIELNLMQSAGMSAMHIILAGTRNAAHVCLFWVKTAIIDVISEKAKDERVGVRASS